MIGPQGSAAASRIHDARSGTEAKKAAKEYEDEALVAFSFEGKRWPLQSTMAFHDDWLCLRALLELQDQRPSLLAELAEFQGFADIEFNPRRLFNCQGGSCGLFVVLSPIGEVVRMTSDPISLETLAGSGDGMPSGPLTPI